MKYYTDEYLDLYLGDCRNLINDIKGYDLIFTGPPYGLLKNYGVGKDNWKPDRQFWKTLFNNSISDGKLLVNVGTNDLCWWLDEIRAAGWIYNHSGCYFNERKEEREFETFPHCWEPILFFSKNGGFPVLKERGKLYTDVYRHHAPAGVLHPCPNDFNAFKQILEIIDFNILFDPFCGTGTSLLCAKDRNKKSIGIEQNVKFCDITIERFKNPNKEFKL